MYQNKAISQSHVFLIKSLIVIKLGIFYCPLFHAFLYQQHRVVIEYRWNYTKGKCIFSELREALHFMLG